MFTYTLAVKTAIEKTMLEKRETVSQIFLDHTNNPGQKHEAPSPSTFYNVDNHVICSPSVEKQTATISTLTT